MCVLVCVSEHHSGHVSVQYIPPKCPMLPCSLLPVPGSSLARVAQSSSGEKWWGDGEVLKMGHEISDPSTGTGRRGTTPPIVTVLLTHVPPSFVVVFLHFVN